MKCSVKRSVKCSAKCSVVYSHSDIIRVRKDWAGALVVEAEQIFVILFAAQNSEKLFLPLRVTESDAESTNERAKKVVGQDHLYRRQASRLIKYCSNIHSNTYRITYINISI